MNADDLASSQDADDPAAVAERTITTRQLAAAAKRAEAMTSRLSTEIGDTEQ